MRVAVEALLASLVIASPLAASEPWFEDATGRWGLEFRHHQGATGTRYMPETLGGGVAILDYDLDGDWDLFFVDSGVLDGAHEGSSSALYRNEGGGRFLDVTAATGITSAEYGMGVAVGDVDGDDDPDLYVTALGANRLWLNDGQGSFVDGTAAAGVGDSRWSASAAFGDLDRDGDLDLYVTNYVDFSVARHRPCENLGIEVYCHPSAYPPQPDRYYRNEGDGAFSDATAEAGFAVDRPYAGLGVAVADLTGDGWLDVFVANDSQANFLFRNAGDGTFVESGLLAGVAYGSGSSPEAGMGVAVGDLDGDDRLDLVVTNFELETNAFYRGIGGGLFNDGRFQAGLAEGSLFDLSFGIVAADFDQDGLEDLLIASGHVLDNAERFHERSRFAQRNRLWRNSGAAAFVEVEDSGLDRVAVSRGAVTGDLDGDGDLDLVIANNGGMAEVYANRTNLRWLQVDLGGRGEAGAVGARARVVAAAGTAQVRELFGGGSYLARGAPALHFGLGSSEGVARLDVDVPGSPPRRSFRDVPVDRRLRLSRP